MATPHPHHRVKAADIRGQLAEFSGTRGTATHLLVSEELMHRFPEHSRVIVEALPELGTFDPEQCGDLWKALTSPRNGVPRHPRKRLNHLRAVRHFVLNVVGAHGGDGVKALGKMLLEHDDPGQYTLVMCALTNDDLRVRLASEVAAPLFLNAIRFPEAHLPQCQALLDEVDSAWFERKSVRDIWQRAWLTGSLQAKLIEPETSGSILDVLMEFGVDINEPGDDGLNLLEGFVENTPYGGLPFHRDMVNLLLDRGAGFERLLGQDLPHDLGLVLDRHPTVKRFRLGRSSGRKPCPEVGMYTHRPLTPRI